MLYGTSKTRKSEKQLTDILGGSINQDGDAVVTVGNQAYNITDIVKQYESDDISKDELQLILLTFKNDNGQSFFRNIPDDNTGGTDAGGTDIPEIISQPRTPITPQEPISNNPEQKFLKYYP